MSMQHTPVERPFKAAMPAFERAFFVAQADSPMPLGFRARFMQNHRGATFRGRFAAKHACDSLKSGVRMLRMAVETGKQPSITTSRAVLHKSGAKTKWHWADSLRFTACDEFVMQWRALATEPPCVSMRFSLEWPRMLTHGGSVALFALWGSFVSCRADFIGAPRALVLSPNGPVGNRPAGCNPAPLAQCP